MLIINFESLKFYNVSTILFQIKPYFEVVMSHIPLGCRIALVTLDVYLRKVLCDISDVLMKINL